MRFHLISGHGFPRFPGDEAEVVAGFGEVEEAGLAEGDMVDLDRVRVRRRAFCGLYQQKNDREKAAFPTHCYYQLLL